MDPYLTTALDNRDVFTTIITLGMLIVIIMPIVWVTIRQTVNQNKAIVKHLEDMNKSFAKHSSEDAENLKNISVALEKIHTSIDNHDKNVSKNIDFMRNNIGRKTITEQEAILMIKKAVLSGSYKKLDYLKKRLNKNNLKGRRATIERQVDIELRKASDEEYLDFLDNFVYNGVRL